LVSDRGRIAEVANKLLGVAIHLNNNRRCNKHSVSARRDRVVVKVDHFKNPLLLKMLKVFRTEVAELLHGSVVRRGAARNVDRELGRRIGI